MSDPVEKKIQTPSDKPRDVPVQLFQEMERRDEKQILAEMAGELVQDFVYDIVLQGKHITNLSICGVHEAIRQRGNVQELEVTVEETEKEYRARVRIRDLEKNVDWVGGSTCEKDKPFAYVLALNKAERNAHRKVIPEKWIATLIHEYLERRKSTKSEVGEEEQAANTGISASVESPVPTAPGPGVAEEKPAVTPVGEGPPTSKTSQQRTWKVPIDLNPEKLEGLDSHALKKEGLAVGRVIYQENEAAFIPTRPFSVDDPALIGFLQKRILNEKVRKHGAEFQYEIVAKERLFEALRVRAPDKTHITDLEPPCAWTFHAALTKPDRSEVGSPLR